MSDEEFAKVIGVMIHHLNIGDISKKDMNRLVDYSASDIASKIVINTDSESEGVKILLNAFTGDVTITTLLNTQLGRIFHSKKATIKFPMSLTRFEKLHNYLVTNKIFIVTE